MAAAAHMVESAPPRRLVLTWARPNETDNEAFSRVTFEIEEFMGSARLTVTHSDLTPETLRHISAGWPAALSRLKTLQENRTTLPKDGPKCGKAGWTPSHPIWTTR